MGHKVGNGKITPLESRVEALKNFPEPTTKWEVRSFFGIAAYYQNFIHDFSSVASPLTEFLQERNTRLFTLSQKQRVAFETLKTALTTAPILSSADFAKDFVLQKDASNTGTGAVLTQHNGEKHPIAYKSRKLSPVEQCYLTMEREALALKWGMESFRY